MEAIRDIMLPDAPALVAGPAGAVWLDRDGEVHTLPLAAVAWRMRGAAVAVPYAGHGGDGFVARLIADDFSLRGDASAFLRN